MAAAFSAGVGRVVGFDEHRGVGRVADDDTGDEWFFHCTRIADGSRTIGVGDAVTFEVVPGPVGLEAVAVSPRS